jgi:hypothetical protein
LRALGTSIWMRRLWTLQGSSYYLQGMINNHN